jgi:hypothetical protein
MLLGTTDATGTLLAALPGGVWNLTVTDGAGVAKTLGDGDAYQPTPALIAVTGGAETPITLQVAP